MVEGDEFIKYVDCKDGVRRKMIKRVVREIVKLTPE